MAPEYLIQGQLTEKADVYSFGVLVLEIVSGQRNSTFRSESDPDSLLHTVSFEPFEFRNKDLTSSSFCQTRLLKIFI